MFDKHNYMKFFNYFIGREHPEVTLRETNGKSPTSNNP